MIYEDGRVYSRKKNKSLSEKLRGREGRKYCNVALYDGFGNPKTISVHRLVAEAFIPNEENKPMVNHIDNNPLNDNVNNLEWVTASENTLHSYHSTPRKRLHKKVAKLDKYTGEILEVFDSVKEAGDNINSHYTSISKVINGKHKTTGGFGWKLYEEARGETL